MESILTIPSLTVDANTPIDGRPSHAFEWFNWAVFLGMSWTWCVGMFLPYLMVRDYGVAAWFVFAIPNVVGAAAMGWIIRSAASSESIAAAHRPAAQIFSAVTIAFHLYFAVSVLAPLTIDMIKPALGMNLALGFVLGGGAAMYLYICQKPRGDLFLSWVVLVVSVTALIWLTLELLDIAATSKDNIPQLLFIKNPVQLAMLAPVCVFGFLGCPYLDMTFHRARQKSTKPRASFSIGFGLFFLAMIIFTLIYSWGILSNHGRTPLIAILLFVHMTAQSAFTVSAHAREIQQTGGQWVWAVVVLLAGASWAGYWLVHDGRVVGELRIGEIIYRMFMGFYGLIFPAYIWLIMLPGKGGRGALSMRNLLVYSAAVLIALPMYWMGFVVTQMVWLVPGLSIVLLARLLIKVQQNSAPI